jgi:2-C-methyl-D-erythritol 2,4-cyclodiphosphate synthase
MKVGIGYDCHRLVPERAFILGGVAIPFAKGLAGHSDADVLVHAVCDAIIGAIGEGDIGRHFPDTDPCYQDISSLILLGRVRELAAGKGYEIHNVDTTIVAERPKLLAHVRQMAVNIAQALHISADVVNIKAKTNEGMGFIGREEGVAAYAVVLVEEHKDP